MCGNGEPLQPLLWPAVTDQAEGHSLFSQTLEQRRMRQMPVLDMVENHRRGQLAVVFPADGRVDIPAFLRTQAD